MEKEFELVMGGGVHPLFLAQNIDSIGLSCA